MEGSIAAMKYRRGLNRLYGVLCAMWFLAWLVGFPLYMRSKDLRDTEFFVQWITDNPNAFGPGTQPKLALEERERLTNWLQSLMNFMKDRPLTQEEDREYQEFEQWKGKTLEQAIQMLLMNPKAPIDNIEASINEKERDLQKKYLLRVANERASLVNVYKRLWKSNWSGWAFYVLLGPLVAYAAIYVLILAVRWVMQGFQKS